MKNRFHFILFGIIIGTLISFRVCTSFIFNTDYTRDLYRVLNIAQGHPTLIGPPLSVGIFSAPYYYYFILPALLLSGSNAYAFLIFNAGLFIAGLLVLAYILSRRGSVLPVLGLALSPFFLIAARGASNAFMYLPFFILFIYYISIRKPLRKLSLILLGILGGLILNFHPVSILAVFPLAIFLFMSLPKKKTFLWFLTPALISFSPLLLFEVKHGLVISKGLISGNYQNFINNALPRGFIDNIFFVTSKFQSLLGINPLIYFLGLFLLLKKLHNRGLWGMYFCSLFAFIATLITLRFQYEPHYLFPTCILIVMTSVVALSKLRSRYLFAFWIIILLISFPKYLYLPSNRTIEKYASASDYVIKKKLVNPLDRFNVLGIIDSSNRIVNGNEYRFFLAKAGLKPLPENDYASAEKLLIFSEDSSYPIDRFSTWETNQFGQKFLSNIQKYNLGEVALYYVDKTSP